MTARERYAALDGLRGFAVLLVFCVHAAGNSAAVALNLDLERATFTALGSAGERVLFWLFRSHHGVFLFFVLSGFLIGRMWSGHRLAATSAAGPPQGARPPFGWRRREAPRRGGGFRRFAWRRTLRIYPAFLLAFAASLLFAWHSGTWAPPDVPRLVGNLLFLNGAPGSGVAPFNLVTWSLFYEMTFYFVFPLVAMLAASGRGRMAVAGAGIVVPAVAAALGADLIVLCWSLLFFGVALAGAEDSVRTYIAWVPSGVIVGTYLALTTAAMLDLLPGLVAMLAFGVIALAIVAKSLDSGNVVHGLLILRPLRALGRVSYSFYLLHWMIVVLVARSVQPHAEAAGPLAVTLVIFAAGFLLSAIAATASWYVAERPYFKWVRRG